MGVLDITNDLSKKFIVFPHGWVATPVEGRVVYFAG
jgi:hypothetical protein